MVLSRRHGAVLALLLLIIQGCTALEHGQVASLDGACQDQLAHLYQQHYAGQKVLPGQLNCTQLIDAALASQDGAGCPDSTDLIYCFALATDAWVSFIDACEPFSPPPNCLPTEHSGALTGSACKRPTSPTGWYLSSASSVYTMTAYMFGTGVVPNAGVDWETAQITGEGEGRRLARRMLSGAGEGEGEGGGAGLDAGCFPDLYDSADFKSWLDGTYQEPTFGNNYINSIGIIFWVLHSIGILSLAAF